MRQARTTRWTAALAAAVTAVALGAARPRAALAAQPGLPKGPPVRELGPSQRKPDRKPERNDDVPPAYRPPPGMCRIWLDNVPPAQQPAPTDCASAVRNRPPGARVLFGDDYVRRSDAAAAGPAYAAVEPPAAEPSAGDAPRLTWALWTGAPTRGATVASVRSQAVLWADAADDSTARRGGAPGVPRPAAAAQPAAEDDWEAGYAAGYRDAMQGRRPRVRGVDRAEPLARGGAVNGYGNGYGRVVPQAGAGTGTAVIVPPGDDPRYFNNGQYPPPGRANGVCLDRDADGWCDDPRFGAPVCRDLDGDGRCDDVPALAAAPYPSALPDMRAGLAVQQGRGSDEALRWLGTTEVIARASALRAGSPSRVTWLDANTGALLQVWSDRDGDGTADRVEVYRGGRRVKLFGR